MFDYAKLQGLAKEKGYTQGMLANTLGISENAFSNKINGKNQFKPLEIEKLCYVLDIDRSNIGLYFFTPKVEVSKLN